MAAQKRARYNGPQKVVVHWPPGETNVGNPDYQTWEVEPGGLLPADAPAKLRDELAANPDWTEVAHAAGSKSDEKE